MGLLSNQMRAGAAGAAGGGSTIYDYQISNSLFFNGTSQALEKTWGSAASDNNKKALSFWIKRSGNGNSAFGSTTNTKVVSANEFNLLEINTGNPAGYSDQFGYGFNNGSVANWYLGKWRDPSAWMHIIWIWNSDESTAVDRLKVYINGVNYVVNDSTYWNNQSGNPYPGSGTDSTFGKNGMEMHIARYQYDNAGWWGGQMADFIMIDGAASYTDFGEFKNGVWIPVDPSGLTFGNNGFHLDFADASSPGNDVSGNNNDFSNIGSIPVSNQRTDSPTFNSDSNGGNFATLGPLWRTDSITYTEGNLAWTGSANERGQMSNWAIPIGTKAYFEYYASAWAGGTADTQVIGINQPIANLIGGDRGGKQTGYAYQSGNGYKQVLTSSSSYGYGWTTGDVVGVAVDRVNHTINFYANSAWQGTFAISSTMELYPFIGNGGGTNVAGGYINFGQDGTFAGTKTAGDNSDDTGYGNFFYDVPDGFLAMCSGNLPVAAEVDPAQTEDNFPQKLFSPKIWTGDGNSGRSITIDMAKKPSLSIIRQRNSGNNWNVWTQGYNNGDYDSFGEFNTSAWYANQGVSGPYTAAPTESALTLTGYGQVNASGQTYVNYKWVANGGTTSTNTTGSIDTTVEVDPSGGFSVVTWTGTGGSVTLGHGLNAAPSMLICKPFTSGAALMDWTVFHKNMGTAGAFPADNSRMYLNSNGTYSVGSNLFVPSGNTSSVFEVNSNINPSSKDMVAFCFTNVEGYIAANNYTGNGSDDGAFIYMGFKPAWFMIKDTGNANNWIVYDSARETFNVMDRYLNPDTAGVEEGGDLAKIDFLSNGVKMRTDHAAFNGSGRNYIYLAFAHNPFKYSLAR